MEHHSSQCFLNCQKGDRDKKIRELGRRQIRVILYEDNRHEAVRIILERLLQDLNPDQYQNLFSHEKTQGAKSVRRANQKAAVSKHPASAQTNGKGIYYIDRGFCMPWKCIPSRKTIFLHNPYILFLNGEMENDSYIIDMIRLVMQQKDCSLLIIMESYRGAELLGVYFNEFMQESSLPVAAILAPGFGDARRGFMADINIYTGAEITANDLIQLGQAESAMVSKKSTILCGGAGSDKAINAQIDKIRSDLNQSTSVLDKERYRQRVNRLLGIAEEDITEKASAVEWEIYVAETMQKLLNSASQGDSNAK